MTTTNPRAIKALEAMKDLGISEGEVRPVLLKLYKLYDKKWELIEDDNYRTLIDAYFESKEDKAYFESKEDKVSRFFSHLNVCVCVHTHIELICCAFNYLCFICLDLLAFCPYN